MQRYANTVLEKVELESIPYTCALRWIWISGKGYYLTALEGDKGLQEGSDDEYNSLAERGKQTMEQGGEKLPLKNSKSYKPLHASPEYSIQLQLLETMLDLPWERVHRRQLQQQKRCRYP